jgi:predicted O-methyltransferase YrrM
METRRDVPARQDMLFLDGRKDIYLSVLRMLWPKLRFGAVVLSDHAETFRKDLVLFFDYVRSDHIGFASSTLEISDGIEFSVLERAVGSRHVDSGEIWIFRGNSNEER